MADVIRFHLDENVNPAVAVGLQKQGIDVTTSQDVGLLGMSDLEQLAYAHREGRVILTEDADFLLIAAQAGEHSGIVYVRKQSRSIGQIIALLELIHGVMTPAEMYGHVEYG